MKVQFKGERGKRICTVHEVAVCLANLKESTEDSKSWSGMNDLVTITEDTRIQ